MEVREQLEIYCGSGLDQIPLERQLDGMPREYYAVCSGAGEQEQLVGVAGLYRLGLWTWSGVLWLGWFAIDTNRQRQGAGAAALEFLERFARARGAEVLKVETLAVGEAAGFYRKHGFADEAVLKCHYGAEYNALVLSKSLIGLEPLDPRTPE
jgi:GNAT superfamily N-acetyltransferase